MSICSKIISTIIEIKDVLKNKINDFDNHFNFVARIMQIQVTY